MKCMIKLVDGSEYDIDEKDFGAVAKMVRNNVDRGIVLSDGRILKTSAVILMYKVNEQAKLAEHVAAGTVKVKG